MLLVQGADAPLGQIDEMIELIDEAGEFLTRLQFQGLVFTLAGQFLQVLADLAYRFHFSLTQQVKQRGQQEYRQNQGGEKR